MAKAPHVTSLDDHGLLPIRRRLGCTAEVKIPFDGVARAARVCLTQLVTDALDGATRRGPATVVSTRGGGRLLRVAVDAEVSSARVPTDGLGHLHWHARRFRWLFPELEADLHAKALQGGRTQLVMEATYRPPGGVVGLVGDVLLGRFVARSTIEAFTGALARSLEDAVLENHCGWGTAARSGRQVA